MGTQDRTPAMGMQVRIVATVMAAFLAYPLASISDQRPAAALFIAAFTAGYAVLYVIVVWRNTPTLHENRAPVALPAALVIGFVPLNALGPEWLTGHAFFASIMLFLALPERWQPAITFAVPAALVIVSIAMSAGLEFIVTGVVLILVLRGLQMALARAMRTEVALRGLRAESARLAIQNERLRIARDVHDIVGQHMASLIVTADRIGRREPSVRDDMAEIATSARSTLGVLKSTINGYRSTDLHHEIRAAAAILDAADVRLETTVDHDPPTREISELCAVLVREATTNILRHGRDATRARLTLGMAGGTFRLELLDDGLGGRSPASPWGNGLRGIAERVELMGGSFDCGPVEGRFRVLAEIPVRDRDSEPADPEHRPVP